MDAKYSPVNQNKQNLPLETYLHIFSVVNDASLTTEQQNMI